MWFLLVFYIGTTTPPTLEMYPMKTRDSCREMQEQVVKILSKVPDIGVKHKTECRKIDVA